MKRSWIELAVVLEGFFLLDEAGDFFSLLVVSTPSEPVKLLDIKVLRELKMDWLVADSLSWLVA